MLPSPARSKKLAPVLGARVEDVAGLLMAEERGVGHRVKVDHEVDVEPRRDGQRRNDHSAISTASG